MLNANRSKVILWLSIPLAILVIIASVSGLVIPGFYAAETPNWQAQSLGQDIADLFLVTPALVVTAFLAYKNRKGAILLWAGIVAYLLYTFVIYCFAVHFNELFILYCASLGLSFFSLFWFFITRSSGSFSAENYKAVPRRVISVYFFVLASLFYFLWLSEIIPAIAKNEVPQSIKEAGVFTNPVHVIDLSVFLPGIFITGILLFKKRRLGYIVAPILLTFFILMDITIGGLIVVMKAKGLEGSYVLTGVMGGLAVISAVLLVVYIKRINTVRNDKGG